jgi:hypothetical protein
VDRTDLHRRILGLADRHRAIGRRHLVAAVAASTEGGAPVRHVESAAAHLMEACGTPSRAEAATTGGDRWAVEPRWDPHHIARVLTGISPSDLVTGPATEPDRTRARALAPTGGAVISLGAARRRHQFAVPVAASRSLGIER